MVLAQIEGTRCWGAPYHARVWTVWRRYSTRERSHLHAKSKTAFEQYDVFALRSTQLKRDLAVLDGAACLGALRNGSLGAYAFSYKRDEFPARNFPARRDVGFVAQRVEEAFPSLVYDDADGFKHVAYGRAAPVLAAALAALAAKHDGLERRVARLEALLVEK